MFQGKRGLVLVRTATLLLIATYSDNMYPSVCVEAVEKLGMNFHASDKLEMNVLSFKCQQLLAEVVMPL